jgi:hypothetical protein
MTRGRVLFWLVAVVLVVSGGAIAVRLFDKSDEVAKCFSFVRSHGRLCGLDIRAFGAG